MPHSAVKVKRQHTVSMGVLTLELGGIQRREREPDADDGIGRKKGADEGHETEEAGASDKAIKSFSLSCVGAQNKLWNRIRKLHL